MEQDSTCNFATPVSLGLGTKVRLLPCGSEIAGSNPENSLFESGEEHSDVHDFISKLPDAVLSHIITFLNVDEALGTRLLSRRWRNLCVPVSNVLLNPAFVMGDVGYHQIRMDYEYLTKLFVERVNRFLEIITIQKPLQFGVVFPLGQGFATHIDNWISLALKMECEKLMLDFEYATSAYHGVPSKPYNFPCHLLLLTLKSHLKHLTLAECIFKPPPAVANKLVSLKSLTLVNVHVEQSNIEIILSGCLNLESLKLLYCDLPSTLCICGPNLRLKFLIVRFKEVLEKMELAIPNLETLELDGPIPHDITFSRLHRLTKVFLLVVYGCDKVAWLRMLNGLAAQAPHIDTLSVNWACDPIVDYVFIEDYCPRFYNVTTLQYHNGEDYEYEWNLIKYLLCGSNQLQSLYIEKDCAPIVGNVQRWIPPQSVPACVLSSLRNVMLQHFHGDECELEFAGYILQNGRVLEMMSIVLCDFEFLTREAKKQVIKKIKAFPRISGACRITICFASDKNYCCTF